MNHQSGSSHLRVLFESALEGYKRQTGIELANHPLAERLQDCNSVESVTDILSEHAQDFKDLREKDKVLMPVKRALTALHRLSSAANFVQHLPPVKAIQTALGVLLLFAVKDIIDDSALPLADFLESIGHLLNHLEIYTEIPPTEAADEMIDRILMELLSTLALTTKEMRQGKLKMLLRKRVGGKQMEVVVQMLDRLKQDETRQLVANPLNKANRDNLQKDIFGWLSPPDPWKNHHAACESRHSGTAEWFIQGNTFSEWKTSAVPGSLLWIHGKLGAGKSVLCSAIIEDIRVMQEADLASLAFFYCDSREDRKKEFRGLLSSFLVQLYHQSNSYFDILSEFYLKHDKGSRTPSDNALTGCLMNLLNLPGLAPVYLIVDALDECPNQSVFPSPRAKVLSLIEELVKTQILNLHVCVFSRPEFDIGVVLDPLIFRSVSLHNESGQKKDIENYIKSVIYTRTKKRWKEEHRKMAIDVVIKKSNGMFRWAGCQVDHICDCVPARLAQALTELPKTLDETYERTLRAINEANWEFAHRMFQFVSVASRPLHVKELADLLAFDFEARSIPKFHEDWRLEDPVDAVLSTCSTLLAIVNDQGSPVIQFSHSSVKEFLTSIRLSETTDIISSRYHVSIIPAHTLVARACLGILLHLDKGVTNNSLEDFPLAEYAAEHWVDHAQFENVSRNATVEDGVKQLFDLSKPHLTICVWIYDPAVPTSKRTQSMTRNRTPLPLPRTFLHHAAFWGLYPIVESLLIEHSRHVRSRDSTDNATPLHLTLRNGHIKAARMLIERGADLNAEDDRRETPLHVASQWGRGDIIQLLLDHGAEGDHLDIGGWTPLHVASHEGHEEIVRLLFDHGADANRPDNGGWTPLHLASWEGHEDIVRLLLDQGLNANYPDNGGWTPLHAALQEGHNHIVELLLDHGADPNHANSDGSTSLHVALQRNHHYIVQLLLDHGADLNYPNSDDSTPLHLASQRGYVGTVSLLLDRGAVVNRLNSVGWASLHLASQRGHYDVVGILIEHGAYSNHKHSNGLTPLHLASQEGHDDIVRLLLDRGADANSLNSDGWTPLHLASRRGHDHVVRLLLERGADAHHPNTIGSASREGDVERKLFKGFTIATRKRRRA